MMVGVSKEKDRLVEKIKNDRPKVILADAVTADENTMLIEVAAKYLRQNGIDIGRDRFFKWLRENGYLNRRKREWNKATQKSLDMELMKTDSLPYYKEDGSLHYYRQTVMTGHGLSYFINVFLHHGQLKLGV